MAVNVLKVILRRNTGNFWNDADRSRRKYWEINASEGQFVHHKSHMDWAGIESMPSR